MKPVHIFIDGQELVGWTDMQLTRSKDKLTGELTVSIFMGYVPTSPIIVDAARGREITVYVGGHLAFTGYIDKRNGTGARKGENGTSENGVSTTQEGDFSSGQSLSIGPNEYTIRLSARGKTKFLIDSSQQHPTTNMLQPTTREVVEKLVEPWGTQIEWLGTVVDLDKVRFRDGCRVVDELHRVGLENCYYMYETRDGKLRITDDIGPTVGDPIILGVNILAFSCEQSENVAKSKIKVKGQRTKKDVWGKDACLETVKEIEDQWVGANIPITVQHYGDATPEALERRARFEANKRSSASKELVLDVFHVQSPSGMPWDIGQLHYVEIPPEGVFDMMECTSLSYSVAAAGTCQTKLTFSPPPASGASGAEGTSLPPISPDTIGVGPGRRAAAGVTFAPGRYPSPWSGPSLLVLPFALIGSAITNTARKLFADIDTDANIVATPPLTLPESYRTADDD